MPEICLQGQQSRGAQHACGPALPCPSYLGVLKLPSSTPYLPPTSASVPRECSPGTSGQLRLALTSPWPARPSLTPSLLDGGNRQHHPLGHLSLNPSFISQSSLPPPPNNAIHTLAPNKPPDHLQLSVPPPLPCSKPSSLLSRLRS